MRILHFIYDHPENPWVGGGGARRVWKLAALLSERGHHVSLVCGRHPATPKNGATEPGVTFLGQARSYAWSTLSYTLAAIRFARHQAPHFDLVIEDFAPWNPLFTYRLHQCPAVVQVQNRLGRAILKRYPLVGWPFYWLESRYPRRFRHAIVLNPALNQQFGIAGEVISMGVDESMLHAERSDGEYIAFLGRLDVFQKGLDLLVQASRRLQLPVRIAGDGPGRDWLVKQVASLDHVQWVGRLEGEKKTEHLRRARLVVVPSRFEGQNMVVLEAAALGKPTIVSDVPELAYACEAGFGLAVETGSAEALASRMKQLWHDAAMRRRMGDCGQPYAAARIWPRIADQFEAYGLRVCRQNPRPVKEPA